MRRITIATVAVGITALIASGGGYANAETARAARTTVTHGPTTTPPLVEIVNHDGKCLDMPGGSRQIGTQVQQWSCNDNPQQEWYISFYGPGGIYTAYVNYNSGYCLSINGHTGAGAAVVQESCNQNNASQNWFQLPFGSTYFNIQNAFSLYYMHPSGGSTANGAKIFVNVPGGNDYLWKFPLAN